MCAAKTAVVLSMVCLLLAACAVGPDFRRPEAPTVKAYTPEAMPARTVETPAPGFCGRSSTVGSSRQGGGPPWRPTSRPGPSTARRLAALLGIAIALAGCGGDGGEGGSRPLTAVEQPLSSPGPYAVACSNIAQDFTRLAPGEDVTSYWSGIPSGHGTPRYVADLLSDPANTLIVTVTEPPVRSKSRSHPMPEIRLRYWPIYNPVK